MKQVTLTEKDLEYVKSFVKNDIIEAGSNLGFFYEMKLEPKDFIDQMTALARMLEMDFWEIIRSNCSDFQSNRLHDLYEGRFTSKLITGEFPNIEVIKKIRSKELRQGLRTVRA